jgi:hypothetical protein
MLFNLAAQATSDLVLQPDVSHEEKLRQIAALRQVAGTAEQQGKVRDLEQLLQTQLY